MKRCIWAQRTFGRERVVACEKREKVECPANKASPEGRLCVGDSRLNAAQKKVQQLELHSGWHPEQKSRREQQRQLCGREKQRGSTQWLQHATGLPQRQAVRHRCYYGVGIAAPLNK